MHKTCAHGMHNKGRSASNDRCLLHVPKELLWVALSYFDEQASFFQRAQICLRCMG